MVRNLTIKVDASTPYLEILWLPIPWFEGWWDDVLIASEGRGMLRNGRRDQGLDCCGVHKT